MERTVAFIAILLVVCIVSTVVGFSFGKDSAERKAPMIGSLNFNLADPEKEFLSLRISEDVDIANPPLYARFKINVLKKLEQVND